MKKIFALVLILMTAWGVLGCARAASPTLAPPGELPTPRISNEMVLTQTTAPEAASGQQPSATPPPQPTLTLAPPTAAPIRATATAAPVDPADAAAIAQIEKGKAILVEAGKLMPFYRAERELRNYQTATWMYILDAQTHKIVEILPVHETAASEGNPKDVAALEQIARAFIDKAAPGTQLEALRPKHSSQTSNYLFRWEDHRARVMDDGMTYPYIQVALSASGQMLNYFNTLVFVE